MISSDQLSTIYKNAAQRGELAHFFRHLTELGRSAPEQAAPVYELAHTALMNSETSLGGKMAALGTVYALLSGNDQSRRDTPTVLTILAEGLAPGQPVPVQVEAALLARRIGSVYPDTVRQQGVGSKSMAVLRRYAIEDGRQPVARGGAVFGHADCG